MTSQTISATPTTTDRRTRTLQPVPRWADRFAHLTALTVLPSGLWRIPLAFGFSMGMPEAWMEGLPGWASLYVIGLSVLTEALALLTFGLVRPWGEWVPGWVPGLGGRRIPVYAAVVPASLGAVALMLLWTPILWGSGFVGPEASASGGWAVLLFACYAPLVLWGPLLAAVTGAYWLRRRQERVVR